MWAGHLAGREDAVVHEGCSIGSPEIWRHHDDPLQDTRIKWLNIVDQLSEQDLLCRTNG